MIRYSVEGGGSYLWMGDLETDFMKNIEDDLELPKSKILFAPHHGRKSGRVPKSILDDINPEIIVIGEADSGDLDYYQGYETITQNSAGFFFEFFDVRDSSIPNTALPTSSILTTNLSTFNPAKIHKA